MHRLLVGRITVYQNRSAIQSSSVQKETKSEFDGLEFGYSHDEGVSVNPTFTTYDKITIGKIKFSSYFVSKDGGELIKVDKKNYRSLFPMLFKNCPFVEQELEKSKDLEKFSNFMILAEMYNNVCF